MSESVDKAAAWMYRGIWKVLSDWFRVPEHPPTLEVAEGEFIKSFHPSRQYLSYIKLYFWIGLFIIDLVILVAWIMVMVVNPVVAAVLALPALAVATAVCVGRWRLPASVMSNRRAAAIGPRWPRRRYASCGMTSEASRRMHSIVASSLTSVDCTDAAM